MLGIVERIIEALIAVPQDQVQTIYMIQEELLLLAEKGVIMHILLFDLDRAMERVILPLLAAHHRGSVSWEIFRTCMKRDVSHYFGVGVAQENGFNFSFKVLLEVMGVKLISRVLMDENLSKSERDYQLLTLKKAGIEFQSNYVFSESTMLPYYILLSSRVQRHSLRELLTEKLEEIFASCADALKVPIRNDSQHGIFFLAVFHNLQLQFVWDIGSGDEAREKRARVALEILSAIGEEWQLSKASGGEGDEELFADAESYVADILPRHFLFIMRNLLQKYDWNSQTSHYQENSVRCLGKLVGMLRESDLCKFLPKVSSQVLKGRSFLPLFHSPYQFSL